MNSSDSLHFREALPADRPAMAAIYHGCVATAHWIPESARGSADFDRDTEGEVLFVVEQGGRLLGFASIWEQDSFIHHLYVVGHAQGLGVGSLLLTQLLHHVPLPWRLKCSCANVRAHAFYLARGWIDLELGDSEAGPYHLMEWGGERLTALSPT